MSKQLGFIDFSKSVYTKLEIDGLLVLKQDVLAFDSTPTLGSSNPVTSDGIRRAIDEYAPVANIYHFMGSVPDYSDLPSSGNEGGDVYNVESDGMNVAWVSDGQGGGHWDSLGGIVKTDRIVSENGQTELIVHNDGTATVGSYTEELLMPVVTFSGDNVLYRNNAQDEVEYRNAEVKILGTGVFDFNSATKSCGLPDPSDCEYLEDYTFTMPATLLYRERNSPTGAWTDWSTVERTATLYRGVRYWQVDINIFGSSNPSFKILDFNQTSLSIDPPHPVEVPGHSFAIGWGFDGSVSGTRPYGMDSHRIATDVDLDTKVSKSGDTMTGSLTVPDLTVGDRENGSTVGADSLAVGHSVKATGTASTAEGSYTTASNTGDHAEGSNTTASGGASHAEGDFTTASGYGSHAEGSGTVARNQYEHSEGTYSVTNRATTFIAGVAYSAGDIVTYNNYPYQCKTAHTAYSWVASNWKRLNYGVPTNTLKSIGVGTADNARLNAVEVMGDGKVFIKGVGGYDGTNPTGKQNAGSDLATVLNGKPGAIINVTWQQLKNLRDANAGAGSLVPGQQYRITDYVATTTQEDTQTANHPFDIIVTSDAPNKLNEIARATIHSGDTYFANAGCKLEAWKVWYCLDNDTDRFAWADASTTTDPETGDTVEIGRGVIYRLIDEFGNDVPYDFKGITMKAYGDTDNVFRYTFDSGDADNNTDYSLDGKSFYVMYNRIGVRYYSVAWALPRINTIVFKGRNCQDNTFGPNCSCITFNEGCQGNVFGNGCTDSVFGNNCTNNVFGSSCLDNVFGAYCINNVFGASCSSDKFGDFCQENVFGTNCCRIEFGDDQGTKNRYRWITVETGNTNIRLNRTGTPSTYYIQNILISQGVNNSIVSYKTITNSDVAQTYRTVYQAPNSQVISFA